MSKTVSFEEPFQLATYTSSYRGKQKSTASGHVFVNSLSNKSKEGLVTVSAQADGVHLVDISSLHSVISHTLGPSTSFSCPAVTSSSGDEYTTYAVVEASSELSDPEEGGRIVWRWRDSLSSVSSEKRRDSRVIVPAPERIYGLYITPNTSRILALTHTGRVLLLDSSSLGEKGSLPLTTDIHRAFLFASAECSFAPNPSIATLVTSSFDESGTLNVYVVSLDANDELSQTARFTLSHKRESIADISCSSSGYFTVLCKDGSWGSYSLSTGASPRLRPLARPFKLANLSPETISITAIGSSHVLLAALPPTASPSVVHIQIWDLQYSVLLSTHSLPLPSAFSSSSPCLKLVPARGQAILSLSASSGASSVFVIPYTVPPQSTLAVAISKGPLTKQWVQSERPKPQTKSKAELEREEMVSSVKSAMASGKVNVAEGAFGAWLKEAEESLLDYNFVKELLGMVLPPVGKIAPPHAPQIVKALLERKGIVSSAMVGGGLLRALRERGKWASIETSFSSVADLPEFDIFETLIALAKLHRQRRQTTSEDAMQVDHASAADIPSLPSFLALCVAHPDTTSKGIVLGLKKWIQDPEDAVAIALVLENWIRTLGQQRRANGEVGLLPSNKDLEKNEHGVWVVSADKRAKRSKDTKKALPPLVKVVTFLQSFMDACFLQLLQHTPSHKLLQQLQAHLVEEVSFSDVLEQLRGPLEPFAVGHQKTLAAAAVPEKEKERQRQKGDWRQRRHGAPGVVGAVGAIGVYQVEELAL